MLQPEQLKKPAKKKRQLSARKVDVVEQNNPAHKECFEQLLDDAVLGVPKHTKKK